MTEIAPDVFCLGPWGRTQTNVHLVRSGGGSALVDAGWAGDADRIRSAVRQHLGGRATPAAIILTHVHPDHAGAARVLADEWRCPIVVHPLEVPIARGDFEAMARFAGPLDRWVILPMMRAIGERRRATVLGRNSLGGRLRELASDGTVEGLEGWSWLATPGHTPGHVSLVRDRDRVVLTGDALLALRVNALDGLLLGRQGLSPPPWYTTWDARAARSSIRALAGLRPRVVGPGHGRPLTGADTADAIEAFAGDGYDPSR